MVYDLKRTRVHKTHSTPSSFKQTVKHVKQPKMKDVNDVAAQLLPFRPVWYE